MKNESLFNRLSLTLLSIFAIAIFLKTPAVGGWIDHLLLRNWRNLQAVMHQDIDQRKLARWGNTYNVSIHIKKYCVENNIKDAVILFEPNEYYKKMGFDFKTPEPVTFYYFTGLRGVWMTSNRVDEATHLVSINKKGIIVREITGKKHLATILETYKDYKTSL